jgi:hypothetical protein
MDRYVNTKLKEVTEMYIKETNELKEQNKQLNRQINELQSKMQEIMSWVIYDNQNYRLWLETELRKVNHNIEFPRCAPPPRIFEDDAAPSSSPTSTANTNNANSQNAPNP